jgi:hypothetical protein
MKKRIAICALRDVLFQDSPISLRRHSVLIWITTINQTERSSSSMPQQVHTLDLSRNFEFRSEKQAAPYPTGTSKTVLLIDCA